MRVEGGEADTAWGHAAYNWRRAAFWVFGRLGAVCGLFSWIFGVLGFLADLAKLANLEGQTNGVCVRFVRMERSDLKGR